MASKIFQKDAKTPKNMEEYGRTIISLKKHKNMASLTKEKVTRVTGYTLIFKSPYISYN